MKFTRWLPFLAAFAGCAAVLAQNSAPSDLTDPQALMQMAWQKNGLNGASLKPWHIHATWQSVDDNGKPTAKGTWEEWWAGERQYKITYATDGYHETWWVTPRGYFVSGDNRWPAWIFSELEDVVTPHRSEPSSRARYHRERKRFGKVQLECYSVNDLSDGFCFDGRSPAIRVYLDPPAEAISNDVVVFQGRFVPRQIQVYQLGVGATMIHVDSVELMSNVADGAFHPPANAVESAPRYPQDRADYTAPRRLQDADTLVAKDTVGRQIDAVVLLDVVVGADGHIQQVEVAGATPGLDQPRYIREFEDFAQYKAATYHGKPIAGRISVAVRYQQQHDD